MKKFLLPILVLLLSVGIAGILGFNIGVNFVNENIIINHSEGSTYTSKVLHILSAFLLVVCIAASHFSTLKVNKPE
ncbi:MAG: hypothetical protein HYR67_16500 [Bacteroidetes bacterium]|nr:hypothetical protein [Bacteroidota bacterium]